MRFLAALLIALTMPAFAADFKGTCSNPVACNAATVTTTTDGHTTVTFTDHGTFTQGWESRLTVIECDVRLTGASGKVQFTSSR